MSADQSDYVVAHVQEALAQDQRVNEPELQVSIVAGRVHVTGVVPTEGRRSAVEDVVREVCDLPVENRTTVARYPETDHEERLT
jgi:osmotically-inducible protein OsmY